MTVYIEFIGSVGSGKTTLSESVTLELAGKSLLLLDATPNQKLTQRMAIEPPKHTLLSTLQTLLENAGGIPPKNEAIDWAFHDLPFSVGDELDLLACGKDFFNGLGETSRKTLAYGFSRLCKDYDAVVIDGFDPTIHALLPPEATQVVLVSLPDVTVSPLPDVPFERTPGLIVNRTPNGELSPVLEGLIEKHAVRLVGRIPHYEIDSELHEKLPQAFRNCFLKLDIPLFTQ